MSMKVAINGFGRIGRLFLRAAVRQGADFEVVAVNDLTDAPTLAHLLKYDSVHKVWPGEVSSTEDSLVFEGRSIKALSVADIESLPWRELGVDAVMECTGRFTDRAKASQHLDQGARKVVISAPAKDPDITVVMGVTMPTTTRRAITSCRMPRARPTALRRWSRSSSIRSGSSRAL